MARSLFKLPYIHKSLWEKSIISRENAIYTKKMSDRIIPKGKSLNSNLYFWKRASLLNKRLAKTNRTIGIYNGFAFITLHLSKKLFGYKVGQFAISRKSARHKGKQRQKKKVV